MWIWIINKESNNCFFSPFDDGACHNKLNRHSVYQHVWLISSMIFTSYTLHILTVLFLLLFQFLFFFCSSFCVVASAAVHASVDTLFFFFVDYLSIFKFCIHHQQWRQRQQRNISTSLSDKTILNIRMWCCHSHSFYCRLLRTFCAYTWI